MSVKIKKDWSTYIPMIVLAYNSAVHDSTCCTPASLMLGRYLRLPIDLALGMPEKKQSTCESDYKYELETQMLHMHEIARKNINVYSDGIKRYCNRNTNFKEHNEGDAVWYLYLERKVGISPKLTRNWKGPYIVIKSLVMFCIRYNSTLGVN